MALLVYTVVVRSFSFFRDDSISTAHDGVLMTHIRDWATPEGILTDIAVIVLVFLQATFINRYVIKYRLASRITLFPGLFYILLCSLLPSFQSLSPELIANTFMILFFGEVYKIYKKKVYALALFNVGFLSGMAFLVQPAYGLLLFCALPAIAIMNAINTKRFIQTLIGALVPIVWMMFFYFMIDMGDDLWPRALAGLSIVNPGKLSAVTPWYGLIVYLVVILACLLSYNSNLAKKLIKARKGIDLLYWLLLAGSLTILVQRDFDEYNLLALMFPAGALISFYFSDTKNASLAELGHFALFVLLLLLNVFEYFT